MAYRSVIASAALVLTCVGQIQAEPLLPHLQLRGLVSPDAAPASAPPAATTGPLNIVPGGIELDRETDKPVAPIRTVANVPLPHLSPAHGSNTSEVTAGAAANTDPVVTAAIPDDVTNDPPRRVDPVSPIPAASPQQPPAAPIPPPAMLSPVEASEAAAQSDDLLGDPADYFSGPPSDLEPVAPQPEGIGVPRRAEPAGRDREKATAASPLVGTQPFELVRTLQSLQDKMAQGSVQALAAQRALRSEIDAVFAAAPANAWQDRRNAAAAVTYVLSGGSPAILRTLAELDPPPAIDERLVDGVLAYAEGRVADATPLLADIDPVGLPASMGAQVAIAQSALAVRTDPARAMHLLAMARLLAPGTLAEEAAIRRQIFIADQLRDFPQVQSLARQYLDHFRHSVYAGNFRVRFAAALSHAENINSESSFPALDDVLSEVEPEARCQLYLTVALASVINNRTTAAKLAAERASQLALAGSVEEARARLYHAGALAAMPKLVDAAVTDLAGVDRELLVRSDQALMDVVKITIAGVRSGTDRAAINVAAAESLGDGELPAGDAVLQRARDALKASADILDGPAK